LEEKHETSLTNQIVLEQEQLSEVNRNSIKQLEAEIELLTSETNTIISTNTQQSKDAAAGERATLGLGKIYFLKIIL
jgi:archaellum component FlaC